MNLLEEGINNKGYPLCLLSTKRDFNFSLLQKQLIDQLSFSFSFSSCLSHLILVVPLLFPEVFQQIVNKPNGVLGFLD